MDIAFIPQTPPSVEPSKKLVHDVLEANKKLQRVLSQRAEKLEAELNEVDRLLAVSNAEDYEDELESEVSIPGSKKAIGLFSPNEFLNSTSPFYEEASRRSSFIANTNPHPMKGKDLEALADAVKKENERLEAYRRSGVSTSNSGLETHIDLVNNIKGLDWSRIAERVSNSSSVKRNATECRVAWIGDGHPRINHADWLTSEVRKLTALVSESLQRKQAVNWTQIAEKLGTNRTPIDCLRHGIPRHRHTWTPEADQKLITAIQSCGEDNWQMVARKVSEHVTPSQCQSRWTKSVNPALKRGLWTEKEDDRLRKAVAGYGTSWIQVASSIPGRTNDQCRERWLEHVSIGTLGLAWTEDEENLLVELVKELGNQWKVISSKIGNNKTNHACRQRYEKFRRAQKNKISAAPEPWAGPSHPPSTLGSLQAASLLVNVGQEEPRSISMDPTYDLPPKPRARAQTNHKETDAAPENSLLAKSSSQDSVGPSTIERSEIRDASLAGGVQDGSSHQESALSPSLSSESASMPSSARRTIKPRPTGKGKTKDAGQVTTTMEPVSVIQRGDMNSITAVSTSKPQPKPKPRPTVPALATSIGLKVAAERSVALPAHASAEDLPEMAISTRRGWKRKLMDDAEVELHVPPKKPKATWARRVELEGPNALQGAEDMGLVSTAAAFPTSASNDDAPQLRRGRSRKLMPPT